MAPLLRGCSSLVGGDALLVVPTQGRGQAGEGGSTHEQSRNRSGQRKGAGRGWCAFRQIDLCPAVAMLEPQGCHVPRGRAARSSENRQPSERRQLLAVPESMSLRDWVTLGSFERCAS